MNFKQKSGRDSSSFGAIHLVLHDPEMIRQITRELNGRVGQISDIINEFISSLTRDIVRHPSGRALLPVRTHRHVPSRSIGLCLVGHLVLATLGISNLRFTI